METLTTVLLYAALVGAAALSVTVTCVLLAKFRSALPKKGNALLLIIGAVAALGLWGVVTYFGVGANHVFGVGHIKQGLDLQGGVSIVYEADKELPTAEEMETAIGIIRNRLDGMGATEADVAQEGTRRIRVDMPGVTDAEEVIAKIGSTAQLTFVDPDGVVVANGTQIVRAQGAAQNSGQGAVENVVTIEFNAEGAASFAEATSKWIGSPISIYLDETLISAPNVNTAITDGNAVITGGFDAKGAADLAALIRAGALPFKLDVLTFNNVGAKLGANSLELSLLAGLVGGLCVLVFMLVIYRAAGIAADIALLFYMCIELMILSLFDATLTLPGIAGIVLSVGMAVDANVIIFERLKDELRIGRNMKYAIDLAFHKAFSAILDGNVTTLIAAVVLFWLGTGPVKGFAVTLGIGIVVSMFSALVITRGLLRLLVGLGFIKPSSYAVKESEVITDAKAAEDKQTAFANIPVTARRGLYFAISGAIVALGVVVAVINGVGGKGAFNLDVEFTGGTSLHFDIGQDFDNGDITAVLREKSGQSSPQVQRVTGTNEVMVKMQSVDPETRQAIVAALAERYGRSEEDILVEMGDVSATISGEMQRSAVLAVAVACLAMLIYVSLRFRNLLTGGSTILCQLHDVLIMLVAYAVLRIPMNYSFIAAILTILGYSINSTIVIFDRVRENRRENPRMNRKTLVDGSVRQMMTRSVYTSLTTLFSLVALYFFGVQSVKEFVLPIIVGVVCGAYSSVFLAGGMWYQFGTWIDKRAQAAKAK